MKDSSQELIAIFDDVLSYIRRPGVDLVWSHWDNVDEAIKELENHKSRFLKNDFTKLDEASFLFAPTGSLQEVSLSNGWGDEFIQLAIKMDKLTEK